MEHRVLRTDTPEDLKNLLEAIDSSWELLFCQAVVVWQGSKAEPVQLELPVTPDLTDDSGAGRSDSHTDDSGGDGNRGRRVGPRTDRGRGRKVGPR